MKKYPYLTGLVLLVFILITFFTNIGEAYSSSTLNIFSGYLGNSDLLTGQVYLPFVMRQVPTGDSDYRIAFVSGRPFLVGIFLMNEDGTGQQTISDGTAYDLEPHWSPDGTRIAFTTTRTGYSDIYIMNSDGSEITQVSDNPDEDTSPVWSPDGAKIAYVSGPPSGPLGLFVVNADGSNPHKVADDVQFVAYISWSPDSSRIVFQRPAMICIVNADGTHFRELIEGVSPHWSPVGERIAFRMEQGDPGDIFVVNADGSGLTNLTNTPELYEDFPIWSPNGSQIAYWVAYGSEIWVMNADGTGRRNVSNEPNALDRDFTWSPDGTRLAFESLRSGNSDIFSVNFDGSNLRNLTNIFYEDSNPDWSPVPTR